MQLNPQLFAEIIDAMKMTARGASGEEKRKTARITVETKLVVSPLKEGKFSQQITACTRDMSMTGLGILIAQPLNRGEQMIARFPRKAGDWIAIICNVKFARSPGDGLFIIGAEFDRIIDKVEVDSLQQSAKELEMRITQSILG